LEVLDRRKKVTAFSEGDLVTFTKAQLKPKGQPKNQPKINGIPADQLGVILGISGKWVEVSMSFSSGHVRTVHKNELRKV
jgi:hypothetical protein